MSALFQISTWLGTDPISLLIMSLMAAACAWCMQRVLDLRMVSLASFPLLLAGGLLADDWALAMGLYPPFQVYQSGDWELATSWPQVSEGLPYVLLSATGGMSLVGLLLITLSRRLAALRS